MRACPKCGYGSGGRYSTFHYHIGRHDIVRNAAGTRLGYVVTRTQRPGFWGPITDKAAHCPHPFHQRNQDPLQRYYLKWSDRTPTPNVPTPATTINIHSKDDARRKAKARQEKINQGKRNR